jgi:hypothetical protein
LGVIITGFWRLDKVVYPGRWDPVELCGDLLHPVVPSPIDYLELECKGRSERVIRGQTRQTIVVVVVEEWSKLRHVSHSTLGDTDVKEV